MALPSSGEQTRHVFLLSSTVGDQVLENTIQKEYSLPGFLPVLSSTSTVLASSLGFRLSLK